jgi:hypothetical protein
MRGVRARAVAVKKTAAVATRFERIMRGCLSDITAAGGAVSRIGMVRPDQGMILPDSRRFVLLIDRRPSGPVGRA